MPSDALTQFAPLSTKTATFRHTATQLSLPGGTPRRGLTARILYSAAANASGANTVTWSIDISYDNGANWNQEFISDPVQLTTVAKSGELFLPWRVVPNVMAASPVVPLAAVSVNISGAGASPTVTYTVDTVTGGPA